MTQKQRSCKSRLAFVSHSQRVVLKIWIDHITSVSFEVSVSPLCSAPSSFVRKMEMEAVVQTLENTEHKVSKNKVKQRAGIIAPGKVAEFKALLAEHDRIRKMAGGTTREKDLLRNRIDRNNLIDELEAIADGVDPYDAKLAKKAQEFAKAATDVVRKRSRVVPPQQVGERPIKPSATVAKALHDYFVRRELVSERRGQGLAPPWTEGFPEKDAFLFDNFRWCHVHRVNDAVSKEIGKIFPENPLSKEALLNIATHRQFNSVRFTKQMPWQTVFDADAIRQAASVCQVGGGHAFGNAHNQCEIYWWMEEHSPERAREAVEFKIKVLEGLWNVLDTVCSNLPCSWSEFHRVFVNNVKGYKDFMAMEVALDFIAFVPGHGLTDTQEWTPMGPGGLRGLNFCFAQKRNRKITDPIGWLCHLRTVMAELDEVYGGWPLHCFQFGLCEFDKFTRANQTQLRFYFSTVLSPKEELLMKALIKMTSQKLALEEQVKELQKEEPDVGGLSEDCL